MDFQSLIADPDFRNLSPAAKQQLLSEYDADFAKMSPEAQSSFATELKPQPASLGATPPQLSPQAPDMSSGNSVMLPDYWQGNGSVELPPSVVSGTPQSPFGMIDRLVTKYAPEIGIMAPGPAAIPGAVAGQLYQDWRNDWPGQKPFLNPATGEYGGTWGEQELKRMGTAVANGAAAWGLGGLAGKTFEKLLAPSLGGISDASKNFINWAKQKNLPFSVDVGKGTFTLPKLFQGAADIGPGRFVTNMQRQKLIQGATDAANNILDEIGLPASKGITAEAGGLQDIFRATKNKPQLYANYNKAVNAIPKNQIVDVPGVHGILNEEGTLDALAEIYKGGTKSPQYLSAKRILNGGGQTEMKDLDWLSKNLTNNMKYDSLLPESKSLLGKIKGATLDDMELIASPEMDSTVGALRRAADKSFADASNFLKQNPLANNIFKARNEGALRGHFYQLYSEGNKTDAIGIRNYLQQSGQTDTLSALDSAYLESVFKNSMKEVPETGERLFVPGKYIEWYNKYGKTVSEIMPEYAENLGLWRDLAQGMSRDYKRLASKGGLVGEGSAGVAALGAMATGLSPSIVVPAGFSLLSALGTMGTGRLGFLRNYLLRDSLGPAANMIPNLGRYGTRVGMESGLNSLDMGE